MKCLWHSTSPWGASSYSVLTARVVPDIVRAGHQVVVSTWYGLQGAPKSIPVRSRLDPKAAPTLGYVVLPQATGGDYGAGELQATYAKVEADVCITCMDLWVLAPDILKTMKVVPWLPVDHDPCPEGIARAAGACLYPMVYSQWGTGVLQAAGVDAAYVPCSADSEVYLPMPKQAAREKLGIPEDCDFLVSMVAANKDPGDRKGFAEGLQGFAKFVQDGHPNARIYLHTYWGGPVNILNLVNRLGLLKNIAMPDQWDYAHGAFDENHMRAIYCASDVLLNPAKSEGFGLPLIEAQMCGTPIAATDFSTTRELLSAGWLISGQPHWSIGADSWRLIANIDSVVEALSCAYAARDNEIIRRQARKGALHYDTQAVFEKYWVPALAKIEELVSGKGKLQLVQF
jgi:glycosyltransferase involved in cell wall biosynthesis